MIPMQISATLALGFGFALAQAACSAPANPSPQRPAPSVVRHAPAAPLPWLDKQLSPDQRAELLLNAMTQDEKLTVVTGYFGVQQDWNHFNFKEARPQSAGLVRGVPRLGFTAQWQTDAGSGVATQREAPPTLERTLLPSGILTASTWNPSLAERSGAMIGGEARASGFNVMLAGGVNLMREPGERPELRVRRRRPAARRHDGGRARARYSIEPDRGHGQALRAQRPGDRPAIGQIV